MRYLGVDNNWPSRRVVLGTTLAAVGASGVKRSAAAGLASVGATRVFEWLDVYKRSDVQALTVAGDGKRVAVEITRALDEPGEHGGVGGPAVVPRGNIWLSDPELQGARRLEPSIPWIWAPSFSPDSRRLAALIKLDGARVGLIVWDLATLQCNVFSDVNVDIYPKISVDNSPLASPHAVFQKWHQFAWFDPVSILFVNHGDTPQQFDLAPEATKEFFDKARAVTARGGLSDRIWDSRAKTCDIGREVTRLNLQDREINVLYRGDVRGLSLAPSRSHLAVISAVATVDLSATPVVQAPLEQTSVGDDPAVALGLAVVDLGNSSRSREIAEFRAVGNVSPNRLPLWSADGKRFAVASRDSYSSAGSTGDDGAWEVDSISGAARRWTARSALDAEFLASLIVSVPASKVSEFVKGRIPVGMSKVDGFPLGQVPGAAWHLGGNHTALWDGSNISVINADGVERVQGSFAEVYPLKSSSSLPRFAAKRASGGLTSFVVSSSHLQSRELDIDDRWEVLGVNPSDGAMYLKSDTEDGTYIYSSVDGELKHSSQFAINGQFKGIQHAISKEIAIQSGIGRGRVGVLQLPPQHRSGKRYPVILWAYPRQQVSLTDTMTRLNSGAATYFPLQYLLTRGFAVFHAPFFPNSSATGEALDEAANAIVPWLDTLNEQPELIADEFGFYGHSNAGYVALAVEAATARFKAIVASSTFPDLVEGLYSSSSADIALDCAGDVIQANRFYYEDLTQPYSLGRAGATRLQAAIRNSPLFRMDRARSPLLLIEGEYDFSPRTMEEVYSSLRSRGVPVEMAYYWGEGHVIASPENLLDTWNRAERFFGRYLRREGAGA